MVEWGQEKPKEDGAKYIEVKVYSHVQREVLGGHRNIWDMNYSVFCSAMNDKNFLNFPSQFSGKSSFLTNI